MSSQQKILRSALFTSCIPFGIFFSAQSHAGMDVYCEPSTEIQTNAYTACNALPALTPANDNQTNMLCYSVI